MRATDVLPWLPSHADQWNSSVCPFGKEVLDNGLAHRARFARGWSQMHEQAGPRIDLYDGATLFGQRARDVPRKPDPTPAISSPTTRAASATAAATEGCTSCGAVDGNITIALDDDGLALGHDRVRCVALAGDFQSAPRNPGG